MEYVSKVVIVSSWATYLSCFSLISCWCSIIIVSLFQNVSSCSLIKLIWSWQISHLSTGNNGTPLLSVKRWIPNINLGKQLQHWSLYSYHFQHHHLPITNLLNQGPFKNRLIGKEQHLDNKYSISSVQMTEDGIGNTNFVQSSPFTGFVTRVTRRVSHVEQELLPFRSTWVHPWL